MFSYVFIWILLLEKDIFHQAAVYLYLNPQKKYTIKKDLSNIMLYQITICNNSKRMRRKHES